MEEAVTTPCFEALTEVSIKAMENSSRSYDEILAFITSEDASKDEEK